MTTSPYVQLLLRDFDTVRRNHWKDPWQIEHVLGKIEAFLQDESIGELYGARDAMHKQIAKLQLPPKMPGSAARRTPTQERVSRCPRCGDREVKA